MIVVVPVDPPHPGFVLPALVDETPLTAAEAANLYEASTMDTMRAVAASGGDLLVNYRDETTLPESIRGDLDGETAARTLAADALGDVDDVRFERQVGSTRSARVGNTVTHLLEREDATSVGVLEPTAALVRRTEIDGAAMSLRRHDVVLGPGTGGSVYLAGFAEPIDFADVYDSVPLSRLAGRGVDGGLSVGFAPTVPTLDDEAGLRATVAGIDARDAADRPVPEATAATFADLGVRVEGSSVLRT